MNRRTFIQLISSASAAALVFDPEKLLWVPGQKKIFIPPPRRLIYAADILGAELDSWGCAVRGLEDFTKYFYDVKIGKAYLGDNRRVFHHVELWEGIKGLNHD